MMELLIKKNTLTQQNQELVGTQDQLKTEVSIVSAVVEELNKTL